MLQLGFDLLLQLLLGADLAAFRGRRPQAFRLQPHHCDDRQPIEQIPVVDRNILRLAMFEILIDNKVPIKVAINEAVEIAKAFGSDNSSKFINGVLGSVSALVSR